MTTWLERWSLRDRFVLGLLGLSGLLVLVLLRALVLRMLFPWDAFIWAESPFMTEMLKLTNGLPIFSAPSDANSMIYAPGFDYLAYALLRPLGLQLDIRACRFVAIALGVAATAVGTRMAVRLVDAMGPRPRWFRLFAFATIGLVLFRNVTADTVHPDNLYTLHALTVFAFGHEMLERRSARMAGVALAIAGLGVLVKQPAILSSGAIGLLVLVYFAREWRLRIVGLAAIAIVVTALACWIVFHDPNARYFTLTLVSRHHIDVYRAQSFFRDELFSTPHRVLLFAAVVPASLWVALSEEPRLRRWLAAWSAVGVFEVLASLASYFKVLATSNSLGIVDVWCAILVVPVGFHALEKALTSEPLGRIGAVGFGSFFVGLLLSSFPIKVTPTREHYRIGHELDAKVSADLQAGKRVMLTYGTMPLVRSGSTAVPLDRASCEWEMTFAGQAGLAGTKARLAAHYYDRIYFWVGLYSREVLDVLEREYRQVDAIPGDGDIFQPNELAFGVQGFMHSAIPILEPKDPEAGRP